MARKNPERVIEDRNKNNSAFDRESYRFKRVWQENHEIKYAFILTELDLALTFLRIARSSEDQVKADRNLRHARSARESAIRFLEKASLSEQREAVLRKKLWELENLYPTAATSL